MLQMRSNKKKSGKINHISTDTKKYMTTNNSNIDLVVPDTDKKVKFEEEPASKVVTSLKKR